MVDFPSKEGFFFGKRFRVCSNASNLKFGILLIGFLHNFKISAKQPEGQFTRPTIFRVIFPKHVSRVNDLPRIASRNYSCARSLIPPCT